ncbi:MAG: hypothetical protein AB8H12_05380 [Lewinella sp.]
MDKLNFYRYAALGLLALNLAILAFFFLYRPLVGGPRDRPGPSHHELALDELQQDAFMTLAENHQVIMRRINQEQKDLLAKYFKTLAWSATDSTLMVPQRYTKLEAEKISGTYDHFLEVKALLRPEQQEKFPNFVERTLKNILGQDRKPPPRPRG